MEHLSGLFARFIYKPLANSQKSWEGRLYDLVEVGSMFSRFETKHSAESKQALQACKDGRGLICIEELERNGDKTGPLLGEVIVEDLL